MVEACLAFPGRALVSGDYLHSKALITHDKFAVHEHVGNKAASETRLHRTS